MDPAERERSLFLGWGQDPMGSRKDSGAKATLKAWKHLLPLRMTSGSLGRGGDWRTWNLVYPGPRAVLGWELGPGMTGMPLLTVLVSSVVVKWNFIQRGCVAITRPLSGTAALIISNNLFGQSLEKHKTSKCEENEGEPSDPLKLALRTVSSQCIQLGQHDRWHSGAESHLPRGWEGLAKSKNWRR